MPTKRELDTMAEIRIVVNAQISGQIPAWRAIEKIGALIIEHQKKQWEDGHK